MRRIFCLSLLACLPTILLAQSYIGFGADNFNGVHGVLFNPANIADSRMKVDVNLVSTSTFGTNTYFEIDYLAWAFDDSVDDFENISTRVGTEIKTNAIVLEDVLGPSAMVTLSEKHSVALTSRVRSMANVNNLDGKVIQFFETEDLNDIDFFFASDINSSAIWNNWVEIGATYARVLKDSKIHFLKGGATLKVLSGHAFMQAQSNDVAMLYNASSTTNPNDVLFDGDASYSFGENFDIDEDFVPFGDDDDYNFESQTLGLGLDLGIVYEYRPDFRQNISRNNVQEQIKIKHISTYKYKVGFSILDLGALNYGNTRLVTSGLDDININTLFSDFENNAKPVLGVIESLADQRFILPARMRLDVDMKMKEHFFLNLNSSLSLVSKRNDNANRYANMVSISPRFESRWATVFSPISYVQYADEIAWGIGGRLGPLFIGSGSVFTNLIKGEAKMFDMYAGVKIPIFHKVPKADPDDPTNGFKSDCDGCLDNGYPKIKTELDGYRGSRN